MTTTASHAVLPSPSALRLAHRFEYGNRVRAFRELAPRRRHLFAAGAVTIAIAMMVVGYRICADIAWLLDPLRTHWPVVALATAMITRTGVARSRRNAERRFATSWLSVAPIAPRDVSAMIRRHVLVWFVVVLGAAMLVVAAMGLIGATSSGGVLIAVLAGSLAGALAGWWSGGRAEHVATESGVRIARLPNTRDATIGLTALGRWPFAARFANLRPRVEARVFGAALLSLPMGIPPLVAVLLLLSLAVVVAATTLLKAYADVVPRAADWLRSTPVATRNFASSSSVRVLSWQCAYAGSMGLLLAGLGARPIAIVASAAGWIAWVIVSMLTALACRHRSRYMRIELVALGAMLATLATIALPAALVAAVVVWIVQWKRAAAV